MYRAGTELTIVAAGSAESFWTSLDFWNGVSSPELQSAVDLRLIGRGIDVYAIDIADRGMKDTATWQYRATVKCASRSDHARAEDVAAVVANAFYEETGYMPTVSITSLGQAAPGPLAPTWTVPDLIPDLGIGDAAGEVAAGIKDTIDKLIENVGKIGMVGIGVAIVVLAIVYLPKGK